MFETRPPEPVQVPMRDGVVLVGDLYRPPSGLSFPTLLNKTPYDRYRSSLRPEIEGFVEHGYAVVIVSFRGRFGSQGIFNEWKSEGWEECQDGYDTIEWAATQSWSTGSVGTFGISADAQWQLNTAPTRPPHLKAMFVSYAANGRLATVEGGAFTSTGPAWHSQHDAFGVRLKDRDDWQQWLASWAERPLPLLMSFIHPGLLEPFMHDDYDDYWRAFDPATRFEDIAVPTYYESGWYDRYIISQFDMFKGVRSRGRDAKARASQRIISGPWVHGGSLPPDSPDVEFGPAARIDRVALQVRWFDRWVKDDEATPLDPVVSVYLMGAEEWVHDNDWPMSGTRPTTLYFRTGRGEVGSLNGGQLTAAPPESEEKPDDYRHDPYHPIPTIGGHGGIGWMWLAGAADQRPSEVRSLTYSTAPLDEEIAVVGEPVLSLFASSSAVDTDFIVTLTDVHPSGYSELLRQTGFRARHRLGPDRTDFIEPGRAYQFEIRMAAVANLFRRGHRIRVAVASSSFPAFLPNPGTDEPMYLAVQGIVAHNHVYHDCHRPSCVTLPVLSEWRQHLQST